jgi:chromosome segregation ATPase
MGSKARNGFPFAVYPANGSVSGEHEISEIEVNDHELMDDEPPSQSRPSYGGVMVARAKASLGACATVDQNLRDLLRTIHFLTASLQGACVTNEALQHELESLDGALDHQAKDYRGLSHRVVALENELRETERRARDERRFLIAEQDAFISVLVGEHERAVKKLEERLAEAERELDERRAVQRPG